MSDVIFSPEIDLGIQNVHVISGEDFVGHTYLLTDPQTGLQTYRIDKPVLPSIAPDPTNGSYRVGLLPVRPYLDKGTERIEVLSGHVIFTVPVSERFAELYRRFTSDIVVATPTSLNSILQS
jgi:hypothetical protein